MDQQEENLNDTARAVQALVTQVSELTQQVQLLRGPAAPPHTNRLHHTTRSRLPVRTPSASSGDLWRWAQLL